MKKFLVLLAACLALTNLHSVQADTIADWTFETSQPSATNNSIANIAPEIGSGTASGQHLSSATIFSSPPGNGSAHSLDADHWSIGDYFEFQTSSLDFTNISISFDQYRSGTGPTNWDFEYSTDGSIFTTALTYSTTNSTSWTAGTYHSIYTFAIDLDSATTLADDPEVYFRLVADSAPSGTAGASRVDNFIVSGTPMPVPEPSTFVLGILGGIICLVALRRRS